MNIHAFPATPPTYNDNCVTQHIFPKNPGVSLPAHPGDTVEEFVEEALAKRRPFHAGASYEQLSARGKR